MTSSIGSVFLGLTVGCARCHNHKFDPILQSDYYRLQAIFAGTEGKDVDIYTPEQKAAHESEMQAYEARLKPVQQELEQLEKPYREAVREKRKQKLEPRFRAALEIPKPQRDKEQAELAKNAEEQIKPAWDEIVGALSAEDRVRRTPLREKLHAIQAAKPAPLPAAYAVANMDKPAPPTFILRVGDVKNKLGQVDPGVPLVLEGGTGDSPVQTRRTMLANFLASPDNPLTARVMVNRIWQFRMGTGLVRTPNDFGVMGDKPESHALLDWLAAEFMERGWSVKAIDRLIVTSSAYMQSSAPDPAKSQIDPQNRLLWRMNRKRFDAEMIRDAALSVAGTLNPKIGGRPVR